MKNVGMIESSVANNCFALTICKWNHVGEIGDENGVGTGWGKYDGALYE